MSETRTLRDRQRAAQEALDSAQGDFAPHGSAAILGKTTTMTTYPTTASAMYAANPTEIDGDEAEGAAATYVADTDSLFFALNVGTQIPPSGTVFVAHAIGGRWVFRFDTSS